MKCSENHAAWIGAAATVVAGVIAAAATVWAAGLGDGTGHQTSDAAHADRTPSTDSPTTPNTTAPSDAPASGPGATVSPGSASGLPQPRTDDHGVTMASGLTINHVHIDLPMAGINLLTFAGATISNRGPADVLLKVTSDVSNDVRIVEVTDLGASREVTSLPVPDGSQLDGNNFMIEIMNPNNFALSTTRRLDFEFQHAGRVTVRARVCAPDDTQCQMA